LDHIQNRHKLTVRSPELKSVFLIVSQWV